MANNEDTFFGGGGPGGRRLNLASELTSFGKSRLDLPADFNETAAAGRGEDESLFARDVDDVLVRRERETTDRFKDRVVVTIDGYQAEVPRAVPATDAQGNVRRGPDGQPIPRTTTIYDAALNLVSEGIWTEDELKRRIPVLCHAQHMTPVAVCRMCSVHISSIKKGKLTPGRKLVPACQHRVEQDMVVTTRLGEIGRNPNAKLPPDELKTVSGFAQNVNSCISLLAEFLIADCRHPDPTPVPRYENELEVVARNLGVKEPRARLPRNPGGEHGKNRMFETHDRSRRVPLPIAPTPVEPEEMRGDQNANQAWTDWNALVDQKYPYSSRTVVVDHDKCIVCDRCVRACSEVKPFKVIGHTGKGYNTRISFDLDNLMRESSCVQCGECMNSCPTGALSLRRRVKPRAWDDSPEAIPQNPNTPFPAGSGFLTADEMLNVWLYYDSPTRGPRVIFPFRSIPYSYLKWNEGSVRKWEIPAGERRVLCRQGEYGTTAFLLQGTGKFHIYARAAQAEKGGAGGFFAKLFGRGGAAGKAGGPPPATDRELGRLLGTLPGSTLVTGEMACLTHRKRGASVVAEADPENPKMVLMKHRDGRLSPSVDKNAPPTAVIYEVTRNLLDMMQRSMSAREDLTEVYTKRALEDCMMNGRLFQGLTPDQRAAAGKFLIDSQRLEFRRIAPGETVVAEGDPADAFYIIRLGTVKVFQTVGGREQVINRLSSNDYFGEVALLAEYLQERGQLPPGTETRIRTATVAAVDPVEVVRIPGTIFKRLCQRFAEVREQLLAGCVKMFAGGTGGPKPPPGLLSEFVSQGLFQGQKMLVLDLLSCTRCDECTRACADSHDGHARLLREGMRFGDFLVATSCRSCHKPYCMEGCPVDAIHRVGSNLEVVIESHCIGCGLCEQNCPYGAIQMVTKDGKSATIPTPDRLAPTGNPNVIAKPRRAVNCDLCNGNEPFCVQACPHEAAYRMDGQTLLDIVVKRSAEPV